MAYVNVRANMPKKEQPKPEEQSTLSKAIDLTETGMKASSFLNKRNERLLAESGYLNLKLPAKEILKTDNDGKEYFSTEPRLNLFARKPGKGPLRKAEDRIRLTDDGKKYFEDLAKQNNTFAREEYLKFVEDKGGNLKNVDLGGWGLSNKKIEKLSGDDKFKELSGKNLDDFISKKPEVKEGMKSVLKGDVPLYDKSKALQEAAKGAASQVKNMTGPFATPISGNFKNTSPGLDSLISPMTGVKEPISNLNIVTSGIQNDAKRWMDKGRSFLGTPSLVNPQKEIIQKGSGLLNTPLMKTAIDPKKAMMDKAMSSIGIKPNFLSGLGPGGFLAQMALGQLGSKLFKPHTVAGKLFKGLFG